jgi:hypothetical protein
MFKSPRFVSVVAALSIAGAVLAGAPAFASEKSGDLPYTFKAKVVNGKTVYCPVKNDNSYQLPYSGCMTKVRWAQHGIAVGDEPQNQLAENSPKEKGKRSAQN